MMRKLSVFKPKTWKNIALFFLLFGTMVGVTAQTLNDTASWKLTMPRHDLHISVGDPLTMILFSSDGYAKYPDPSPDNWFVADIARQSINFTPVINVGYHYRVSKWFLIGVNLSYSAVYTTFADRITQQKVSTCSRQQLSIMPSFRVSWLNKKLVSLYSGASIGYKFRVNEVYDYASPSAIRYVSHHVTAQVTAIGVKVGKQWYGFAEGGFGQQGCLQIGFGYQFNPKTQEK